MGFDVPIAFDSRDWSIRDEDELVKFLYQKLFVEDPEADDITDKVEKVVFDAFEMMKERDEQIPNKKIKSALEVVLKLVHLQDQYLRYVAYGDSTAQHLLQELCNIFDGKPYNTHVGTDEETHEERIYRLVGLRNHSELHNLFGETGCMCKIDFGYLVAMADEYVEEKYLGKRDEASQN